MMDVNRIASLATALAHQRTGEMAGILVLKKALAAQKNSALALLDALPPPAASRQPPHLGRHIDTQA